jgi:putative endonuclease
MAQIKQFAVYILASRMRGTLYIGISSDLPHRIAQHREHALPGFTATY